MNQAANKPYSGKAEAILEAAEELFGAHGTRSVSVAAIAREAGVSKANVFHHFGTKNGLYLAVLKHARRSFSQQLTEMYREDSDFAERLREVHRAHLDNLLSYEALARLFMRDVLLPDGNADARELTRPVLAETFSQMVRLVRAGQESGAVRTELDPAVIVVLLVAGNIHLLQARELLRSYPEVGFADDPETFADQAFDVLWRGIAAT